MGLELSLKSFLENALRNIFKGFKGMIEPNLFEVEAQSMIDAVEEGFGFEYNKPNLDFAMKLAQSGLWFAARKTYKEADELASLLSSGGTSRSWSEFKKLATPIVKKYNQTWLRTEYDTAVRSARIASIWKDIERTADLYPNIEYVHTRAATPREEHLKYVGVIRPINDPFWNTHTPPLGYNCQCSIKPSRAAITAIPEGLPEPKQGLQNNPAKSEQLFSEDHPYAQNAKAVEAALQKEFYQVRSKMGAFFKVKTKKGNIVLVHPSHQIIDIQLNIPTAALLADMGYKVTLPAHVEQKDVPRPDFTINNQVAELKEPASNRKQLPTEPYKPFKNLINAAANQGASIVVLNFKNSLIKFTNNDIERGLVRSFINNHKPINATINTVLLIINNRIIKLERSDIIDKKIDWSKINP